MAVGYKIKMTFDRPADFSQRGWKEVMREAMRQAGEYWHANIMPRHFDQDARSRYGYQPRTANYQKSKIKAMARGKAVGAMDLVLSGATRENAMKRPLIKAFPTRARVDLLVPPYINMKPNRSKGSKAPSLGEELTRLRFDESEELASVAEVYIESVIEKPQQAKNISITGYFHQTD